PANARPSHRPRRPPCSSAAQGPASERAPQEGGQATPARGSHRGRVPLDLQVIAYRFLALLAPEKAFFRVSANRMLSRLLKCRLTMPAGGGTRVHRTRQRGQSLVEFAISSTVLLLLVMGLLDLSRAFYYSVNLQGAAREGARHGAWFNTAARANNYLDDNDVMAAVNSGLNGAGVTANFIASGGCLSPTDGNAFNNKPYANVAYPGSTQQSSAYARS